MRFLYRVFYFFTPFVDRRERLIQAFFKSLTERSNRRRSVNKLSDLLQRDVAAINLWSEYRYKGYRYLRKSRRRQLYDNLALIEADFERFKTNETIAVTGIMTRIKKLAPGAEVDPDRAVLLQSIMQYLSPQRGVYEYRESSSFGRLLRDPTREALLGDCNQIVTLYIYLYSRYYDVRDLKLRTLPGHIALHYSGVDIEATTGTFANYSKRKASALLPVEEIISINLLDVTDSYLSTHEIAARDLLQASRLAYLLSHNREIVKRNLKSAYSQLINSLMERGDYRHALSYARSSRDTELIAIVGYNGAIFELERQNYSAARKFAQYASQRNALIRDIWMAEGTQQYEARRFHAAIKSFKRCDDQQSVKACYQALFFEEQHKLKPGLTTDRLKDYKRVINRMHANAKRSGNSKLIKHSSALRKALKR